MKADRVTDMVAEHRHKERGSVVMGTQIVSF